MIPGMAGSQRTHHVALVRDGTVLVDPDGSLPSFVQDRADDDAPEPTAYATTIRHTRRKPFKRTFENQ